MFHPWKSAFKAMVRDVDISPDQEKNYLYKYTSGEPRRLVDNFGKRQHRDPSKLLKNVWTELERRFGNMAAITCALLEQLDEKAKFEEKDKGKLQEFSDLCSGLDYQLDQLPGLVCLNYPTAIRPIAQKLPAPLRRKWEKTVVNFALENHYAYPAFHIFATMIEKQARLKNHPNIAFREVQNKRSLHRGQSQERIVLKGSTESEKRSHCPFHDCDGHKLTECKAFARKTLEDKIEWIRKAKLCFRCLLDKYIAKDCKADIKCTECGSDWHSSLLHREKRENVEKSGTKPGSEFQSTCTEVSKASNGGLSCSKIVLMNIFLQKRPKDIQRVYSLIDEQTHL